MACKQESDQSEVRRQRGHRPKGGLLTNGMSSRRALLSTQAAIEDAGSMQKYLIRNCPLTFKPDSLDSTPDVIVPNPTSDD